MRTAWRTRLKPEERVSILFICTLWLYSTQLLSMPCELVVPLVAEADIHYIDDPIQGQLDAFQN